jgi:Uma2 family endonuclease
MAVQFVQPHRFTVDQYRRMASIGVIPASGTELVDGVVIAGTRPVRFSSADYHRLAEEGLFREDERVELVDGEILEMTPIRPPHSSCISRLNRLLVSRAPELEVRTQDVLHLRDGFDPQPDAAVYRCDPNGYRDRHPSADDVLFVVEVADSSLLYDRTYKAEHYAAASIPEYWLVDLKRDMVVVMQRPVGAEFTDVREYRHGERWDSPGLGGAMIEATAVLGPPHPGRRPSA